jgi:hypothetical protein
MRISESTPTSTRATAAGRTLATTVAEIAPSRRVIVASRGFAPVFPPANSIPVDVTRTTLVSLDV